MLLTNRRKGPNQRRNRSTKVDASRSYLAVFHPFIVNSTLSFSNLAPVFDSLLTLISGLSVLSL